MTLITAVKYEYRTFEDNRLPKIGIYYIFCNRNMGLCREFKVDVGRYLRKMGERIYPHIDYYFENEGLLLNNLKKSNIQGIMTSVVDGISFKDISDIVASFHKIEFFNTHDWLRGIDVA
jgi:hypothetical protein